MKTTKTKEIGRILKAGGVGVLPTDTIYGLVGSALKPETVARIYRLKKRAKVKKCIVLIGDLKELTKFNIQVDEKLKKKVRKFWPGTNSLILNDLAFRLPKPRWLRKLLQETGPLIAPSANPEGQPPARSIAEAQKYFGPKVDFYLTGKTNKKPSKLIDLTDPEPKVLRP